MRKFFLAVRKISRWLMKDSIKWERGIQKWASRPNFEMTSETLRGKLFTGLSSCLTFLLNWARFGFLN